MHVKLYSAVHKEAPSVPVLRRVCECCAVVYREGTERQQQTAALYQIVSLSLHNWVWRRSARARWRTRTTVWTTW